MNIQNIKEEINKKILNIQILFNEFIKIESKFNLKKELWFDFLNKNLKKEIKSLLLISDFNFIKIKKEYAIIINEKKEDNIIKKNEKFYQDIIEIKNKIKSEELIYWEKTNYDSIYFEIDYDYNFLIYSKNYFYSNIEEEYLLIISINSFKSYENFKIFENKKVFSNFNVIILKIFEVIVNFNQIINLNFKNVYRNLLIELLNFFDLLILNKIYSTFKNYYNEIEFNSNYNEKSKNVQLIFSNNYLTIYNIENDKFYNNLIKLFWKNIKELIDYNIFLINHFKILDNINNHLIYFFNDNDLLIYNNSLNINNYSKNDGNLIDYKLKDIFNSENYKIDINKIVEMCKELKLNDYYISKPKIYFQFFYKSNNILFGYLIMVELENETNNNNLLGTNIKIKNSSKEEDFFQIRKEISFIPVKKLKTYSSFSCEILDIENDNNELNKENNSKIPKFEMFQKENIKLKKDNRYISNTFDKINVSTNDNNNSILKEFLPSTLNKNNYNKTFNNIKKLKNYENIDLEINNLKKEIIKKNEEIESLKLHFNKLPTMSNVYEKLNESLKNNWNLNILKLNDNELIGIVYDIFKEKNFFEIFKIKEKVFFNFVWKIKFYSNFKNNSFHNFYHQINVFHSLNYLLNLKNSNNIFKNIDLFSLLIASLGHDLNHTGYNNDFEINSNSKLALKYNDEYPLENYHCYILFKILNSNSSNLLHYASNDYEKIRKLIIYIILNSCMKKHFELLNKLQNNFLEKNLNYENDLFDLASIYLHIADLNCNSKSLEISLEWNKLLNQEFSNQYKKENELNIQVTQYFKDLDIPKVYHENELKFIKYIIQPIYDLFYIFIDENKDFEKIIDTLEENKNYHEIEYKSESYKLLN